MTNLREAYAATHHANLDWNEERERAVDRVAAAGMCDALGIALWKAKYMLEVAAYHESKKLLVALYRDGRSKFETPAIVEKIADQVLHEYLSDKCSACGGAKELVEDNLRVTCAKCDGSGVRRYTDMERARTMQIGLDRVRRLDRGIRWLAAEISSRDLDVNSLMADQLERG